MVLRRGKSSEARDEQLDIFELAQIDATYGHLLPDSEDYLRGLLDEYDGVRGLSVDLAAR